MCDQAYIFEALPISNTLQKINFHSGTNPEAEQEKTFYKIIIAQQIDYCNTCCINYITCQVIFNSRSNTFGYVPLFFTRARGRKKQAFSPFFKKSGARKSVQYGRVKCRARAPREGSPPMLRDLPGAAMLCHV